MAEDNEDYQTVKLNVGGRLFETNASLIKRHGDSILAVLLNDTRQDDPSKPVFIDRNGDIFALVLDYLRYGSITLPITVSREMFLRDLEYYGIVPVVGTVKPGLEEDINEVKRDVKAIKRDVMAFTDECDSLKSGIMRAREDVSVIERKTEDILEEVEDLACYLRK